MYTKNTTPCLVHDGPQAVSELCCDVREGAEAGGANQGVLLPHAPQQRVHEPPLVGRQQGAWGPGGPAGRLWG